MDRLSPLDSSFLHIEDGNPNAQMHIGSVGIFDGPPPRYSEMTSVIGSKLHRVPRYRQVVMTVPGGIGRPVWADDPGFSIEYHIRRTALPAPGDDDALRRLTERIMSQRLDRTKPLWEIWVVEGLPEGRWAMISKVHHAMVDGVSGAELLSILLDLSPEYAPDPPTEYRPAPLPNPVELVAGALQRLATSSYEQARVASLAIRRRQAIVNQGKEILSGLRSLAGVAQPAEDWSLVGPITAHRSWTWASSSLDDIKTIRTTFGGSVNDVVLAAITAGFRELLRSRGEVVEDHVIRTLIPVSVRTTRDDGAATSDGVLDNKVSAMFANLPVGVTDPVERLRLVRGQMSELKESNQAVAAETITRMARYVPPGLAALATSTGARFASASTNLHTVTTNVPGPQFTLYSMGSRMRCLYPYVPLAAPLRTGVAIFSYDGQVTFGITGDKDNTDDIDVLARATAAGIQELVELAGEAAATPAKPSATAPAKGSPTKASAKKTPAKTTAASKTPAKKAAAKKAPAKRAPAKKAPAKKAATKRAPAKKVPATKAAAKKAATKRA